MTQSLINNVKQPLNQSASEIASPKRGNIHAAFGSKAENRFLDHVKVKRGV
jgi:hypothetical protein